MFDRSFAIKDRVGRTARAFSGFVGIVLLTAGCSDTTTFEDRADRNPPTGSVAGFVGYADRSLKLTTCGTCHTDLEPEWKGTAHSVALATLEDAGAREFCYGCHAVSERGNEVSEAAGFNVNPHPAYHDVQCESCHGPGETHVGSPGNTGPLASIAVSSTTGNGCGACHNGTHHPFVEEWSQSGHSKVGFQADRDGCRDCHSGQGRLEAWGVDDSYVEAHDDAEPIVCAVCHDPHDGGEAGQLRFPVETTQIASHLCARCHDRGATPDEDAGSTKPHSPESQLLVGTAGWFPPNADFGPGEIIGTHGSPSNPTLCAGCHVQGYTVTDDEGGFVFAGKGHLFAAAPCVGSDGIAVPGDCGYTPQDRTFLSCVEGCHQTEDAAAQALTIATNRLNRLVGLLDGQLVQVPAGEIDPDDGRYSVAEGATFNLNVARERGSTYASAAHNPFLTELLLTASIEAVQMKYGIAPSEAP
jgi:predicted CXXCH cytochrome family protein